MVLPGRVKAIEIFLIKKSILERERDIESD